MSRVPLPGCGLNLSFAVLGTVVLAVNWNDTRVCDAEHRARWKTLALIYTSVSAATAAWGLAALYRRALSITRDLVLRTRKALDSVALIW